MSPTTEAMIAKVVTALLTGTTIREIAADMKVSHQHIYQTLKKSVDPDALLKIYEKSMLVRQQARGGSDCAHCGKFIKVAGMRYCSPVCRTDGKAAIIKERTKVCKTILELRRNKHTSSAIAEKLGMSKFMINHYVGKYSRFVRETIDCVS